VFAYFETMIRWVHYFFVFAYFKTIVFSLYKIVYGFVFDLVETLDECIC